MRKDPHIIELPKKVIVGRGVLKRIPSVIKDLKLGRKIHVVTGPNVFKILNKVIDEVLNESDFEYEVSLVKSSNVGDVREVWDEVRVRTPDVIIGLGGGKSIDAAKYVSAELGIPFISVPTTASHDGIASPFASIRGLEKVTSVMAKPPVAVIADLDVISNAPKRLLISGAGDLLGKLTAVLDWRLAHRLKGEYYGDYSAQLALLSAKHIITSADVISAGGVESASIIIEGLVSSSVAMCIAGSSRPGSGSEHLFSHALDIVANHPALHGEQVAVGTIMMSYLHGRNWRKIKDTLKRIGLPTTAKELGVKDVDIIEALTMAHKIRPERYTILGDTGLTYEAAEALARRTGVIE